MKDKLFWPLLLFILITFVSCRAQTVAQKAREDSIYKPGHVNPIRDMRASRAAHTATLLNNGRVLIAGGFTGSRDTLSSIEVFDPATNTFSPAGNMNDARAGHTATVLPDGRVLIAGGYNGNYLQSAEIYDPETGKFAPAGKMTLPRSGHVAVLLKGGKVLLAGGVGTGWTFLADAELFDPSTGTFAGTGSMAQARESHTATLLQDGRVLITGGHRGRRSQMVIYSSAEIYDPSDGRFTAAGSLSLRRHKHDAALLADGRVLIVGGADERDSQGAYASVEVFDPRTKSFARIGDMNQSRYKLQGTTVQLKNGKILIAGGGAAAEVFDPASNAFAVTAGSFETRRLFATATLLGSGQVLIAGGYDENTAVSQRAWIYKP